MRRAAARHVPPAHRVPAEQDRRARNAPRGEQRNGRLSARSLYLGPWRIDVTRREGVEVPPPITRLGRAAAAALDAAGAPKPASLGLILSDDGELAALNAEHMGEQGPTDVLSFPLLPPGAFPPHEGQDPDERVQRSTGFALPPGRRPHLGDIVVSVERAGEQAMTGRGGHAGDARSSLAEELLLLVVHGTLHICGWDHADRAEESAMRRLEWALLRETDRAR